MALTRPSLIAVVARSNRMRLKATCPTRLRDVRGGLVDPVIGQVILSVLAAAVFDTGACGIVVFIGATTHWAGVAMIAIRRRNNLKPLDVALIKYGYLLYTAIAMLSLVIGQRYCA